MRSTVMITIVLNSCHVATAVNFAEVHGPPGGALKDVTELSAS